MYYGVGDSKGNTSNPSYRLHYINAWVGITHIYQISAIAKGTNQHFLVLNVAPYYTILEIGEIHVYRDSLSAVMGLHQVQEGDISAYKIIKFRFARTANRTWRITWAHGNI